MNEPEYERTYDASDPDDRLAYAGFLWAFYTFKPTPLFRWLTEEKQETWQWHSWDEYDSEGRLTTIEPIREPMLLPASVKTPSRPKGKRRKAKGSTKGPRTLGMQQLSETLQGDRSKEVLNYFNGRCLK